MLGGEGEAAGGGEEGDAMEVEAAGGGSGEDQLGGGREVSEGNQGNYGRIVKIGRVEVVSVIEGEGNDIAVGCLE